jgi:hypothetical protein
MIEETEKGKTVYEAKFKNSNKDVEAGVRRKWKFY